MLSRALAASALRLLRPAAACLSGGRRALTEAALDAAGGEAEDAALEEFRDSVRSFASSAVAPLAAEIDRQNSFPAVSGTPGPCCPLCHAASTARPRRR